MLVIIILYRKGTYLSLGDLSTKFSALFAIPVEIPIAFSVLVDFKNGFSMLSTNDESV